MIEVAIPLNQIRFPAHRAPQTWGFDVGRSYPRSVRHRIASTPGDAATTACLCQVDKVTGFEELKPGRNLELTPRSRPPATTRRRSTRRAGWRSRAATRRWTPGLSARWGITPNLSLNAAINPDFSQVEADVAQLDVNERFALFFPEKRPFFLEGIDLFATRSRRSSPAPWRTPSGE